MTRYSKRDPQRDDKPDLTWAILFNAQQIGIDVLMLAAAVGLFLTTQQLLLSIAVIVYAVSRFASRFGRTMAPGPGRLWVNRITLAIMALGIALFAFKIFQIWRP